MLNFLTAAKFFEDALFILIGLMLLMVMVTIHELGHYISAKLLKFKVNEFAIGVGPKIFSRKSANGEVFSIRVLPLGGFCAFEGEDEENPSPQAFNNQKPWKRLVVLFSGAFMNFLSAIVIAVIAFSAFGDYLPKIISVNDQSPNYGVENSIKAGDTILKIDGKKVLLFVDFQSMIANAPDVAEVLVLRDGKEVLLTNVQKGKFTVEGSDKVYTGWGIVSGFDESRVRFSFGEALTRSVPYCARAGGYILESLGKFLTGLIGIDQFSGPISTIDFAGQVARSGIANILFLVTVISVNLAVFNLLPIPALDGSRMIFVLIEWIKGSPVNRNVEGYIHLVGLVLLFGFMIMIDVLKWI